MRSPLSTTLLALACLAAPATAGEPAASPPSGGVAGMIAQLSSEKPVLRMEAAWRLGDSGPLAAPAIPALIAMLKDDGDFPSGRLQLWQPPDVIWGVTASSPGREAAHALARIGPTAAEPLLAALTGEDRTIWHNAGLALAEMHEPRALPVLLQRGEAMLAAKYGDPAAASALAAYLHDWFHRYEYADALVAFGPRAIPALMAIARDRGLTGDRAGARSVAVEVIGRIGDRGVLPDLIALASDANGGMRYRLAEALAALAAPPDPASAAVLRTWLRDPDWKVREQAAIGLGRLGDSAATADLITLAADPDVSVRGRALQALGSLKANAARNAAIAALSDRQPFPRRCALGALQAMKDPGTVPAIIPLLASSDPRESAAAAAALGAIGDPAAISALIGALGAGDEEDRAALRRALATSGGTALPALVERMAACRERAGDDAVLRDLAAILTAIGADAAPPLRALLKDRHWTVEVTAGAVLAGLGKAGLAQLLAAAEAGTWRAVPPLGDLGSNPDAAAMLVRLVAHQDAMMRREAVKSLQRAGIRQRASIEALVGALDDKDGEVRSLAANALPALTGKALGATSAPWRAWLQTEPKTNEGKR